MKSMLQIVILKIILRFGSFEIFKPVDEETGRQGPSVGRTDILKQLLNYTVSTFYPQVFRQCNDTDLACTCCEQHVHIAICCSQ